MKTLCYSVAFAFLLAAFFAAYSLAWCPKGEEGSWLGTTIVSGIGAFFFSLMGDSTSS